MKTMTGFARMVLALPLAVISIACASVTPMTPSPQSLPTSPPTPSSAPALLPSERYSAAFGIDYGHPDKYLVQGEQTHLSNPDIINTLRRTKQSLTHLGEIYFWIKREFTTWSAGGSTIGKVTVDQLLAERRLGGCHDWGLVYASIARELGYPVVMVDTMGIAWAKRFQAGQPGPYAGHVFVEVFVAGRWVLVDSTNNWYVEDGYDPTNPVIPIKLGNVGSEEGTFGLYVMRKGADTWGYGIRSNDELTALMRDSARQLENAKLQYPPYNLQQFK